MRHVRLRHHCSLCEAFAMMRDERIPREERLEVFNVLKGVAAHDDEAIDYFEQVKGQEDLFKFLSDNYWSGSSSAAILVAIRYNTGFDGVLHVVPEFTSAPVELDVAIRKSLDRRDNGKYYDTHEPH